MSTVCRNCRVRVQRLQGDWNNTPSPSGSRRQAPRALRPERGVTQSIPIDGLVATPWSAVDRGNCKSDPEAKIAAFLKVSQAIGELSPASSRTPHFFPPRCNRLGARAGTSLPFSPESDEMS
jgi:hypothetical protein